MNKKETFEKLNRQARSTLKELGQHGSKSMTVVKSAADAKLQEVRNTRRLIDAASWNGHAARACEELGDAVLMDKPGTGQKIVKFTAAKLGFAGAPAALLATASLLGTASTGTAIGSLSGAAFTSAALAWIGGSVAMGSIILGVATVAGGMGAALGAGYTAKKLIFGKKREQTELSEQEKRILDASLALAIGFRNQEQAGRHIDPLSSSIIYGEALKPLCDELLEYKSTVQSWPWNARQRVLKAIQTVEMVSSYLLNWSKKHPSLSTGIISVVLTKLLASDTPWFSEQEELVLDALRRSNRALNDADIQELSDYVKSMSPEQLIGLKANIKGIYHELLFQAQENADGDDIIVKLHEATNHMGSDAVLINTVTGAQEEIQLKASPYASYMEQHFERFATINLYGTDEAAQSNPDIFSTGIENAALNRDVSDAFQELETIHPDILESLSVAGMITLARNVNVLLKGNRITDKDKQDLIKDGMATASVCGLLNLVF